MGDTICAGAIHIAQRVRVLDDHNDISPLFRKVKTP
jgi:hypothetical protein